MQVWQNIKIAVEGKGCEVRALFDTGSSFTVMGYSILKEFFGEIPTNPLPRPMEAALANGEKIVIDSYVDSQIVVDDYVIADRIYLSKDLVKEVIIEGRRISLPSLIIGSPTMETWGIELDLKRGEVIIRGGGFLL